MTDALVADEDVSQRQRPIQRKRDRQREHFSRNICKLSWQRCFEGKGKSQKDQQF